ncbi:hypothetical protein LAUMK41_04941 [Mycobacterium attenuatum]|nr:hypothetical protein LAUMK41_04941 [Mycobacterium attenuatum]
MLTRRTRLLTRSASPRPDVLRRRRDRWHGVGGSYRGTQRAGRQRHADDTENTGRYAAYLRHSEHLSRLTETSPTAALAASTLNRP